MHPDAEVRPDGTVLVCLHRAPISPPPPLDRHGKRLRGPRAPLGLTPVWDHGDSRIGPEALAQMLAEFRPIAADHDEPSAKPPPACPFTSMALPSAGPGPVMGTRVALVGPSSIACLAIVFVAN